MRVPLTVPLKTDDGREFAECYVVVDVFVSHPATPATWNSPATGPEWDVDEISLELGTWSMRPNRKPIFISEVADIPEWLMVPVKAYVESRAGQDDIATQIQDGGYE